MLSRVMEVYYLKQKKMQKNEVEGERKLLENFGRLRLQLRCFFFMRACADTTHNTITWVRKFEKFQPKNFFFIT